jgi:hypothetical protein
LTVSVDGWVNFVTFSLDSETLIYATHDSELNFADITKPSTFDEDSD